MGRFKVGDIVEPSEESAPGFRTEDYVHHVVVDNRFGLTVATSEGNIYYPFSYEIRHKYPERKQQWSKNSMLFTPS